MKHKKYNIGEFVMLTTSYAMFGLTKGEVGMVTVDSTKKASYVQFQGHPHQYLVSNEVLKPATVWPEV